MKILLACLWGSLGLILYTYLGYPLILLVLNRGWRGAQHIGGRHASSVSLIIAAYNEEEVIAAKISNCHALDYPPDKLEILIGSDGSTDRTVEIVRAHCDSERNHPKGGYKPHCAKQIRLFEYPDRAGKASVLNELVPHARGDILVFSDANSMYAADAIHALVGHFADNHVGGVCGELVLENPNDNVGGAGEGLYWRYEKFIKRLEGRLGILVAANGAIYAIRRELFVPLPTHKAIMDDFLTALRVLARGYCVVYEPAARATEYTSPDMAGEFRRKVRIGAANFNVLPEISGLLHPRRGLVALALWSHKILRWCVPFLLLMLLATNCALLAIDWQWVWAILCGGQLIFYLSAAIGCLLDKRGVSLKSFIQPYYFVTVNLALLVGFFRSVTRTQQPAWQRVARQSDS